MHYHPGIDYSSVTAHTKVLTSLIPEQFVNTNNFVLLKNVIFFLATLCLTLETQQTYHVCLGVQSRYSVPFSRLRVLARPVYNDQS